jgi:hypothetical protein
MRMLSEDDLNLRNMSADELDAAWDLWFDLAQTTNDSDPLYSHGVFAYGVTRGIREFMARDWAAPRRLKDAYWGARIARLGPDEGLRIADELRRQMQLQDSSWPSAALRDADLAAHIRLADLFQRAGAARRA